MNRRKNIILVFFVVSSCFARVEAKNKSETEWRDRVAEVTTEVIRLKGELEKKEKTIEECRKEIREKENVIEQLKKNKDDLLEEVRRLKTLCSEAGINPTKGTESNPSNYIIYRGRQ